eukprot:5442017-Amphidinium_carterae.1
MTWTVYNVSSCTTHPNESMHVQICAARKPLWKETNGCISITLLIVLNWQDCCKKREPKSEQW